MAVFAGSRTGACEVVPNQRVVGCTCSRFHVSCACETCRLSRRREFIMRHLIWLSVFVFGTTLLVGCGTTRNSRHHSDRPTHSEPPALADEAPSQGPPPPAPPAYGVSFVRQVGFLQAFGGRRSPFRGRGCDAECGNRCGERAECCGERGNDGCCDTACGEKDGCSSVKMRGLFGRFGDGLGLFGKKRRAAAGCSNETAEAECCDDACTSNVCCDPVCGDAGCGCGYSGNERHPCLAECLDDPFVEDEIETPVAGDLVEEALPEETETTPVPEALAPVTPAQVWLSTPFTGISLEHTRQSSFPDPAGRRRQIVEPPRWRGRRVERRSASHQQISVHGPVQPSWQQRAILIVPRQRDQ
jgi:hypothetical protein